MNACLYCTDHVPAFRAFCNATCEGLFGITSTDECQTCQETYRVVGYAPDGRPIVGCRGCGEGWTVPAPEEVATHG